MSCASEVASERIGGVDLAAKMGSHKGAWERCSGCLAGYGAPHILQDAEHAADSTV